MTSEFRGASCSYAHYKRAGSARKRGHNRGFAQRRVITLAPAERVRLPFRWAFVPAERPSDRTIEWSWRAYDHAGKLVMSSEKSFDSLTDCMADARAHGYGGEGP